MFCIVSELAFAHSSILAGSPEAFRIINTLILSVLSPARSHPMPRSKLAACGDFSARLAVDVTVP
jgi:hypothetical protein